MFSFLANQRGIVHTEERIVWIMYAEVTGAESFIDR